MGTPRFAAIEIKKCLNEWIKHGHEVKAASNGLECAEILCDFVPDAVLLDCDLCWGGCVGVIALMHDHPTLSQTPTILIADEDQQAEFANTSNPTLVGWLTKPFLLSELLTQIEIGSRSLRSPSMAKDR